MKWINIFLCKQQNLWQEKREAEQMGETCSVDLPLVHLMAQGAEVGFHLGKKHTPTLKHALFTFSLRVQLPFWKTRLQISCDSSNDKK